MTVMATEKTNVVGIRFQKLGKLYHFKVKDNRDLEAGDHVIVETKRGQQLGQVIAYVPPNQVHKQKGMRYVQRKANPRDLVMKQVWETKELDALISCREAAGKLGIKDAKFVKAEFSFDGSWITFHYTTEDKNLNVNRLKQSLGKSLRTRVEMRLIGPRDVAKIMGGFGACGAPRCCSTFLTEFSPISIRMAKEQGVSLSPQEITGMCGRLRCCLVYEYEQYVEAKKTLPKVGKMIGTPYGEGKVKDVRVLRDSVVVVIDGEWKEVFRHEFEPLDELKALQEKAENGCDRHESGGCDCGARSPQQSVPEQTESQNAAQTKTDSEQSSKQQSGNPKDERSRRRNRKSRKRNQR
jgi:cell fate regulator YaaT (PSP1 superfamily)